ncbi:MAG: phasin family protein [Zoogloeaceae bacterium]|jgi:phasin family protein|nr:phasin family protein [Zoogloeaceae bacterium]
MSNEPFAKMHSRNIDIVMKLTQVSLDNTKRLMALQAETARNLFEDSVNNARALTETKDPEAALALRARFAQDASQKMVDAMRRMTDLTTEAHTEFNSLLSQQMADASQEITDALKKMMATSGLPFGSEDPFVAMQKAFSAARDTFEQISKVSTTAFAAPAASGKGGKSK